jgi:hypothetical protein
MELTKKRKLELHPAVMGLVRNYLVKVRNI